MATRGDPHEFFKKADKNNDGLVSIDELQNFLNTIGIQTEKGLIKELVGQENLNENEFVAFYETIMKSKIPESDLRKAFEVFDENGDGLIGAEELQKVLRNILGLLKEVQDCKRIIEVYDKNGDGLIDFEEFKVMMS